MTSLLLFPWLMLCIAWQCVRHPLTNSAVDVGRERERVAKFLETLRAYTAKEEPRR